MYRCWALGEIDLANIRAIIAQTWFIRVLMPQLVLNFAKKVMDARPGCLFIYCLLLAGTDFYVMLIDRAGACLERCRKLTLENVDEGNKKFLTILAGLLLMSDEELGQSCVVKTTTPESAVVTLNGKAFTFNPQTPIRRPRGSLISRATAIYRATSDACVIKFSWPDILTQSDELSILKATRARMEALGSERGTTRVPKLLGGQVIGTVKSLRYDLNYTGSLCGSNTGEVLEPQYLDRQLVCLAVGPVGQSIKAVKNPRELVTTIRDIVLAIRDLFQVDIVHRDISVGNILLLRDPGMDDVCGLLVDFDHATDLQNPRRDKSFPGTVPFMSIGSLVASSKGARHEQTYLDDLESLLYVFVTLLWEFYGDRFENIPDTSTKVRVQYAVQNWRPENEGTFRKEFMTSYAAFKVVAFYDMLYESGPIKHGLSALGPSREVVFNTIIDAFRKFSPLLERLWRTNCQVVRTRQMQKGITLRLFCMRWTLS
jgi:Fungal protein kinase